MRLPIGILSLPGRLMWAWCALAIALSASSSAARGEFDAGAFERDLRALSAAPSRITGSPGHEAALAYVEQQAAALGDRVEVRRHEFDMMVPVTRRAELTLPGATPERVYPFWPAGVRVNSTPAAGLRGRLVYCGSGQLAEWKPKDLAGQIAVIEASAGGAWQQAFSFGARAVIVLGSADTTHVDLREHELLIPANLPRFYVPPGPLAERLRLPIDGEATLVAQVEWQARTVVNLYALVRPAAAAERSKPRPPPALMIAAPLDSSSLVPDLSPGAGQAVQPAAALGLLRAYAARPPPRPVVVCFTSGDPIQLVGVRQMLLALAEAPAQWRRQLAKEERDRRSAREDLARALTLAGSAAGLNVQTDRRLIDRVVKLVEADITEVQDELFRLRRARETDLTPELITRRDELDRQSIRLNKLRHGFQARPAQLAEADSAAEASAILRRAEDRLARLVERDRADEALLNRRIELYQWLAKAVGREADPDERDTGQRLIDLIVGLDISDRGGRVGPAFYGTFQRSNALTNVQDYREWFARLDRDLSGGVESALWWGGVKGRIDPEPLSQVRAPQAYLAAPIGLTTEMAQAWGVPGMTLATLDDLRLRRDTPADTLENLDLAAVVPQAQAVHELLTRAAADERFSNRVEPKRQRATIDGRVVSGASGRPVPDLPRDGFVVSYYYLQNIARKYPLLVNLPYACGVRRNEVIATDSEGRYRIEGLPQLNAALMLFAPQAYKIDAASGAIVGTSDVGRQSAELKLMVDIRQDNPPQRLLVFGCQEFTLVGLYDPRYLQELGEVVPVDARRNAEPQRVNMLLFRQVLAGFVEPGTSLSLLFRYGRIGNRLVLLNMPEPSAGAAAPVAAAKRGVAEGYTVRDLLSLGPLALATARDFIRLDAQRLAEYRAAGVSSTLIDSLHATAREQLAAAQASLAANDAAGLLREANGAWANEARVYDAARDLASDVVRGAIFLLILCAPFAFCVERLAIGTPNVYRQIAGTILIFAVMTAALWSFHPAFKISASPLIIVLAFLIIFMSSIVIWVVYRKFDVELKRLRSSRGGAAGDGAAASTSVARGSVVMSAVLLGIANMRRRRFRTILTSLTIVLITFTVLCFTSSQSYIGTTSYPTGVSSSHPGIEVRQRSFRPMTGPVVQNLAALLGPGQRIVEQWWNVSASDPRDLPTLATGEAGLGKTVGVAVLGLSPGIEQLCRVGEVMGEAAWKRLEQGERDVIYLPAPLARQLGVAAGDRVRLGGLALSVAAVFEPEAFDQRVVSLAGEPLTPLRYTSGLLDASGRRMDDEASGALDVEGSVGGAADMMQFEHLPASQVAIVPAAVSRVLPNAQLRRIGTRFPDESAVRKAADEVSRRFGLALFAGMNDGVQTISAGNLSNVSGGARVAIPLLIGGMIIFNTMMGSIAERKREIHVYTSLGLAPLHVGALFVAEAMTYGLIGVVFGYVIGQGAGTLLSGLGWLSGVTLNYSGTSAVATMSLILAVVLLSALIPARLASKVAAPSIDRTWRVPEPQGDEIRATLPFTINRTAADGVLAYIAEFLDAHREGSIGRFSADRIEPHADDQTGARGLSALIWLTPFDLGIRQQMHLRIEPSDVENVFDVKVRLIRLSGDDSSWHRMNRTFLTQVRQQFLLWRSLSPAVVARYVAESRALLERAGPAIDQSTEPAALAGGARS